MGVLIIGISTGAATGVALSRTLASQMFGLGLSDPTTIGSALVLVAVTCLASGMWALVRVNQLDPVTELRAD